jgi:hypothetical protein
MLLQQKIQHRFWNIQPTWYGEKCFIIATGPSLSKEDCDKILKFKNKFKVIAINDAYTLFPEADLLYACDEKWWLHHEGVKNFKGKKCSMQPVYPHEEIVFVENLGVNGISTKPGHIYNGRNSSYQAMNIALQLGCKEVYFLGLDMGFRDESKTHFFGNHPKKIQRYSDYSVFIKNFEIAAPLVAELGMKVFNCTKNSALKCFEYKPLEEVLYD